MRHLIDTYIAADEPRKISPFDNMSLLDLIVKAGIDLMLRRPRLRAMHRLCIQTPLAPFGKGGSTKESAEIPLCRGFGGVPQKIFRAGGWDRRSRIVHGGREWGIPPHSEERITMRPYGRRGERTTSPLKGEARACPEHSRMGEGTRFWSTNALVCFSQRKGLKSLLHKPLPEADRYG